MGTMNLNECEKALKLTYLNSENPRNTQVFIRGIFRENDGACGERVLNHIRDMTFLITTEK